MLVVGAVLCSCGAGSDARIELDPALRSTRKGEFSLIVVTGEFISFQRDAWHKYQYYFAPPLSKGVVKQIKTAAEEAHANKHEVHIMDMRNDAAEIEIFPDRNPKK